MIALVFTVLALAPAVAALLSLAVVAVLVARMHAAATAPYEPSMGDAEEWRASIDVALGGAWWQDGPEAEATAASAARRIVAQARCLLRVTVRAMLAPVIGQGARDPELLERKVHAIARGWGLEPRGEAPRGRDPPPGGAEAGLWVDLLKNF